jgi:hypothetical protein
MSIWRNVPKFLVWLFWILVAIILVLVAALIIHHFGGFSLSFHVGDFGLNVGVS